MCKKSQFQKPSLYFSCLFFCSTLFEFIKLNITLCQQSYHDLVSSPHHRQTKFYLSARTLVSKYRTPLLNIGLLYFNIKMGRQLQHFSKLFYSRGGSNSQMFANFLVFGDVWEVRSLLLGQNEMFECVQSSIL